MAKLNMSLLHVYNDSKRCWDRRERGAERSGGGGRTLFSARLSHLIIEQQIPFETDHRFFS